MRAAERRRGVVEGELRGEGLLLAVLREELLLPLLAAAARDVMTGVRRYQRQHGYSRQSQSSVGCRSAWSKIGIELSAAA